MKIMKCFGAISFSRSIPIEAVTACAIATFAVTSVQAEEFFLTNYNLVSVVTDAFKEDLTFNHTQTENLTLINSYTSIPQNGRISLPLGDWRVVRSVDIDVEAVGSDSRLELIVNGVKKASIFIPGHDPHHTFPPVRVYTG